MSTDSMRKTVELPAIETSQDLFKKDPLGKFTHREYKCRGCGIAVKNDVLCDDCINEQVEEAANMPSIFVWEEMDA